MVQKLLKLKAYPLVFQIISLLIFILIIEGGIGITTDSPSVVKHLRNTNLSNLIVWSYWWPIIILTAVLWGRQWCSICPIELLSFLTSRIGFKKKVPKFIQSGWIIPILYSFIAIVAIHTWGIHRYPNRMAYYLLFLAGLAIIVSLIFKKRAFCSYFCPVGKLLGLYSLLSNWGIRVKSQDVCITCKNKECISNANQFKLIERSCQSELYPAKINDNKSCIVCTQCINSCSKNNVELKNIKHSYYKFNLQKISWAEVGMLVILIGFVCYENMSSWKFSDSILRSLPHKFNEIFLLEAISYNLLEAIVLFLIVPVINLSFLAFILKITGKDSFKIAIKKLVTVLLPVIAFGHVFKVLMKTSSRLPYWQYALKMPDGIHYAECIASKQVILQQNNWLHLLVIILGISGLLFAGWLAFKKIEKDNVLNITNQWIYCLIILVHLSLLLMGPISYFF